MIRVNELKGLIVARGMTQIQVAKMIGMSARTFRYKLKKGVFNNTEIQKLIKVLDIKDPMRIFFADDVAQ